MRGPKRFMEQSSPESKLTSTLPWSSQAKARFRVGEAKSFEEGDNEAVGDGLKVKVGPNNQTLKCDAEKSSCRM